MRQRSNVTWQGRLVCDECRYMWNADALNAEIDRLAATLTQSRAEVRALREDATRLDWLEREANTLDGIHLHDGTHSGCNGLGLAKFKRTLREAIDNALAAAPTGAGACGEVDRG
jgi:hypothetical protein